MLGDWQIYSAPPKWVKDRKKCCCWEQCPSSVERPRFPCWSTLCCLVLLFSHSGVDVISCDMRKHVLCLSWPGRSSAVSPPSSPPSPKHPPPSCFLCVYEHQNAIRPSKTPLVPGLAGPTVAVHSQPSGRWLFLTTGPLLQPLWKIPPPKKKQPFLRRNPGKWKTDRTTGADNTRQNTITLHQVTVGHCNCSRQQRDGGGCGSGGLVWRGVASANGVMSYETPEWQLVNWEGLADQIKCINVRKWISTGGPRNGHI